jgi:hypothetical protein
MMRVREREIMDVFLKSFALQCLQSESGRTVINSLAMYKGGGKSHVVGKSRRLEMATVYRRFMQYTTSPLMPPSTLLLLDRT